MTDPKLREARIAEAKRRANAALTRGPDGLNMSREDALAHRLCDLIEQDWRPEPEVDAVTLAAREWMKGYTALNNHLIDEGQYDDHLGVRAFRAGHAHALANCADVKRMDWLEGRNLTAYESFRHVQLVHRAGSDGSLRTKIDRAMEGGQ